MVALSPVSQPCPRPCGREALPVASDTGGTFAPSPSATARATLPHASGDGGRYPPGSGSQDVNHNILWGMVLTGTTRGEFGQIQGYENVGGGPGHPSHPQPGVPRCVYLAPVTHGVKEAVAGGVSVGIAC